MRLIDADALKYEVYNMCQEFDGVQMLIGEAPTIDAVPVVRCKDCKCYDEPEGDGWCYEHDRVVSPDDFCSYGERKDT